MYTFRVTGVVVQSGTTNTLAGADHFDKGDTVTCSVNVDDGTADADSPNSSTVTVQNTLPTITSVSLTYDTADPQEASELACEPQGWADDDDVDVTEYYTFTNPNRVDIEITVDDPQFLTQPYTFHHYWVKTDEAMDSHWECDADSTRREVYFANESKYEDDVRNPPRIGGNDD